MRKIMYPTRYITPEAVGYLVAEYIRCGKPGCRCERSEKHGPYWYLHFRRLEGGAWRQRKRYVPAKELPALRRRLDHAKAKDTAAAVLLRQSRQLRAAVRKRQQGQITDSELKEVCNELTRATAGQA